MNSKELHQLDDRELNAILTDTYKKIVCLEAQRHQCGSIGKFDKAGELQNTRKLRARVLTILHMRTLKNVNRG